MTTVVASYKVEDPAQRAPAIKTVDGGKYCVSYCCDNKIHFDIDMDGDIFSVSTDLDHAYKLANNILSYDHGESRAVNIYIPTDRGIASFSGPLTELYDFAHAMLRCYDIAEQPH